MTIVDDLSGRERDTEEPYELSDEVYYYLLYVEGKEVAICRGELAYKKLEEVGKHHINDEPLPADDYEITTFGFPVEKDTVFRDE